MLSSTVRQSMFHQKHLPTYRVVELDGDVVVTLDGAVAEVDVGLMVPVLMWVPAVPCQHSLVLCQCLQCQCTLKVQFTVSSR